MTVHYEDDRIAIHHGDSLDVLRELPDCSVDSVVTDPPYGLAELPASTVVAALTAWLTGDREHVPDGPGGFMSKSWDRSVPPPALWDECLRVLKPGGHLLAFAAPRTSDLMTISIRLAGFEIRDSIAWIFAQGFAKALDVAKAIDKTGGQSPVVQAAVLRNARERAGMTRDQVASAVGCKASSVANWEDGRARAAGKAIEFITPSPQYRSALADLLGYTADERAITGTNGDRRGDGTVYGLGHSGVRYGGPTTEAANSWSGWRTSLKPAQEPITVARKPMDGTVAGNVLTHGTGALNIDACRTSAGQDYADKCASVVGIASNRNGDAYSEWTGARTDSAHAAGRWPTNVVLDEGAAIAIDREERENVSRYFPVVRYEAKADARERPRVDGVAHPTVKPLALMEWLVRLVTPPGGVCLDPFAGSGTTVRACQNEGFRCIAVEREADYLPLIMSRISQPVQISLFADLDGVA